MKLYTAKKVFTADKDFTVSNAFVVDADQIVKVGEFEHLKEEFPTAEVIADYQDQCIYPGFIEPHMHFITSAVMFSAVTPLGYNDWPMGETLYKGVRTSHEYRDALVELIENQKESELIIAWGHYQPLHGSLDKEYLDSICPDTPLVIWGASCHKMNLNSAAIKAFNVQDIPADTFGMYVDENGQATGVVAEQAMMILATQHLLPKKVTPQGIFKSLSDILMMGRTKGVTTAMDLGLGLTGVDRELAMLQAADGIPGMPRCRKGYMWHWQSIYMHSDKCLDKSFDFINSHYVDNNGISLTFPLKSVKFFADGAMSDYEVISKHTFTDGSSNNGWMHTFADRSMDTIREDMQLYWDHDYNICIHTQGDLAHDTILDTMYELHENKPGRDGQMFIQHFGLTDDNFFKRVIDGPVKPSASITPYYSYQFNSSWKKENVLTEPFYEMLQRGRSAIDAGMMISANTDVPLMPTNPMLASYILMTRADIDGELVLEQEAVSREEGLRSITSVAAQQHLLGDNIGSLEVGKLADFTVLDFDWLEGDLEELKVLDATAVFIGGEPA
ncbi:amidohydrolase family protein [Vibrio lamellibrachiae]|uniref:amidohydrolase n=1 Tax=Vibrio lamellibrachiae TaxID=2910253 RepID=UPI003D0B29E2